MVCHLLPFASGTVAIDSVYSDSALLVINGASLNCNNALLASIVMYLIVWDVTSAESLELPDFPRGESKNRLIYENKQGTNTQLD